MLPFDPLRNPGQPARLRLGSLELVGFAMSGLASYVILPAQRLVFDLGHCPHEAVRYDDIFLSHVHQDHAGAIFRHASLRAMQGQRPARIHLPAESLEAMREVFRAHHRLEGGEAPDLERMLRPLEPGDVVRLRGGLRVEVFDVVHRIASRGFTLIETRRKLRPAYAALSGPEIAAARRRGVEVHEHRERVRFTYIGDSTVETLRRHPEVGRSEVLCVEATYLGRTALQKAAAYGHTHLDELVALFDALPEALASPHIVLKHFSLRYSRGQILDAIAALPEGLRERVTALLPEGRAR